MSATFGKDGIQCPPRGDRTAQRRHVRHRAGRRAAQPDGDAVAALLDALHVRAARVVPFWDRDLRLAVFVKILSVQPNYVNRRALPYLEL